MTDRKRVAVLGSTGSVGRQALDVIRAHPGYFEVIGLAAGRNQQLLAEQVAEFRPRMIASAETIDPRRSEFAGVNVVSMVEMATDPEVDVVLAGVVGKVGLEPVLAALAAGKSVALANKEAMVMAGNLIAATAARGGGQVRPVDSEHSAIWQCLAGHDRTALRRLIVTASGGALRDLPIDQLAEVGPAEALAHPTWSMGKRITIDSATLFNKGLEVIEARWLFDVPFDQIDVVLHRESIIHSMVELVDGAVFAQLSNPDMRLPILYALSYPERLRLDIAPLDFVGLGALHFGEVDLERYPCLGLALQAGAKGGTYPAALAAADEEAVEAFLEGGLLFLDIPALLADTLDRHVPATDPDLDQIMAADAWARTHAREWIKART